MDLLLIVFVIIETPQKIKAQTQDKHLPDWSSSDGIWKYWFAAHPLSLEMYESIFLRATKILIFEAQEHFSWVNHSLL